MSKQHQTPCRQCPWRKDSPAGYLGASTPLEFLQTSEAEVRMPCHMTVDYDDRDWEYHADRAPQCAGRAVHFKNRCKSPKENNLMVAEQADRQGVFSNPQDFITHHTLDKKVPQIMITMGYVQVIGYKDKL